MKGTRILTNNIYLLALQRRCADAAKHVHRAIMGVSGTGARRSAEAASYPRLMAVVYALATRTGWLQNAQAEPRPDLIKISLKQFQDNVALNPADLTRNRRMTVTEGAGTSASSGEPAPQVPRDHWMETELQWIRIHEVPRFQFWYPGDSVDGPLEGSITDIRVTQLVYHDGTRETKEHNWRDPHHGKLKTRMRWTGRSTFFKRIVEPSDAAAPDVSGAAVEPGSIAALKGSLAGMRQQLAKAQKRDPRLAQIISRLHAEKTCSYIAEPRGPENMKVKTRSLHYRMTADGLLVAKDAPDSPAEDLPVVPDVPHEEGVPGVPKNMTWKHFFLAAVHNTTTGHHRRAEEMVTELKRLVAWWPPEHLLRDCRTWRERCKVCVSVFSRPSQEPAFQAIRTAIPFFRLQIDLLEVKPTGANGERYVLTVICVATRYPFLRAMTTRDSVDLAMMLLDVILDAGVVPSIIQSDNEFCNIAFEELCTLLGSTQLFSTALRPQSQGIVERSHRDIRAYLAILVETYVRSNPRKWPQYLRLVEHRLRHKTIVDDITPYSATHGYRGSSTLRSALGALQEIPHDVVWADWLRMIVSETNLINASLSEHWHREAESRARRHSEKKPEPSMMINDLVLLTKPFYEKGTGVILPQCDGPYAIYRFPTAHTALLTDPLSGEPAAEGKPVSVARLIRFRFPSDWAGPDQHELALDAGFVSKLRPGCMICVQPKTSQFDRIHVARVEKVFADQGLAEVTIFWVAPGDRTGPWQARKWSVWADEGVVKKEVVTQQEYVCQVELQNGALTQASLESLIHCGVPASSQPRRDSTLPPRR